MCPFYLAIYFCEKVNGALDFVAYSLGSNTHSSQNLKDYLLSQQPTCGSWEFWGVQGPAHANVKAVCVELKRAPKMAPAYNTALVTASRYGDRAGYDRGMHVKVEDGLSSRWDSWG